MFNAKKFEKAKFTPRTGVVPVEALEDFFDNGARPEWHVRGMDAVELLQCNEAGKRQSTISSIVTAITQNAEMVQAVREAIGLGKHTPGEIVRRLEMLVIASVNPVVDLPVASKLASTFPVEFMLITNKITELTGQGFDLVKPVASSQTTPTEA